MKKSPGKEISVAEALALLPSSESVHTLVGGAFGICGCDVSRHGIEASIRAEGKAWVTADMGMDHVLGVQHKGQYLYVELNHETAEKAMDGLCTAVAV